jgi:hypothetical protein
VAALTRDAVSVLLMHTFLRPCLHDIIFAPPWVSTDKRRPKGGEKVLRNSICTTIVIGELERR